MGIDGFGTFLRKLNPALFRPIAAPALVGKRLALDMHLFVFQMFYRNMGDVPNVTRDVERFIVRLKHGGIVPTFVFDGKTSGLKPRAHTSRREALNKSTALLTKLQTETAALSDTLTRAYTALAWEGTDGPLVTAAAAAATATDAATDADIDIRSVLTTKRETEERMSRVSTRVLRPSFELFSDIKVQLTVAFGAHAVVTAEDDGERHVAVMCAAGDVDFAVSSDYDTLVFGAPNLLIDFLHPEKMCVLMLPEVLLTLQLDTVARLRDFCILCGCDFCDKVPGVGPVSALKYMHTYKSIEGMFDAVLKPRLDKLGDNVDFNYAFARARFAGPETPPRVDESCPPATLSSSS
jgi:5'-3' exonuclease